MILDENDKKIIAELSKNARMPVTKIAHEVGISQEKCLYRINNLIRKSIIKKFFTNISLGYHSYKIAMKLEKINKNEEDNFVKYLENISSTHWITTCSGSWDILFSIISRNKEDFYNDFKKICNYLGSNLNQYEMVLDIKPHVYSYAKQSLNKVQTNDKIGKNNDYKLTEKDKSILNEVYVNPRIKFIDISKNTGIDVNTIKYRIKNLEKNKIITGYSLVLNNNKLNLLRFNILVKLSNLSDEKILSILEFCQKNKYVEFTSNTIGSWDLEITLLVKNELELQNFLFMFREKFSDLIKGYDTLLIFNTSDKSFIPKEFKNNIN